MAMRRSELTVSSPEGTTDERGHNGLDQNRIPEHVAIIMDGNGRWARLRGLSRISGHRAGGEAVRRTVEASAQLGLKHLTLYAFSTENWKRSRFEVRALMDLLVEYLRRELPRLRENNIKFRMIGDPSALGISVLEQIRRAEIATFQNTGLRLNIALNYGSRAELVCAVRQLAQEVAEGKIEPGNIDEKTIGGRLYTAHLPDPDLVIRTSGEMRLSNFLLWQSAYAELYVTPTLWPDFSEADLVKALATYQKRERRFGGLSAQPPDNAPDGAAAVHLDESLPALSRPR